MRHSGAKTSGLPRGGGRSIPSVDSPKALGWGLLCWCFQLERETETETVAEAERQRQRKRHEREVERCRGREAFPDDTLGPLLTSLLEVGSLTLAHILQDEMHQLLAGYSARPRQVPPRETLWPSGEKSPSCSVPRHEWS